MLSKACILDEMSYINACDGTGRQRLLIQTDQDSLQLSWFNLSLLHLCFSFISNVMSWFAREWGDKRGKKKINENSSLGLHFPSRRPLLVSRCSEAGVKWVGGGSAWPRPKQLLGLCKSASQACAENTQKLAPFFPALWQWGQSCWAWLPCPSAPMLILTKHHF